MILETTNLTGLHVQFKGRMKLIQVPKKELVNWLWSCKTDISYQYEMLEFGWMDGMGWMEQSIKQWSPCRSQRASSLRWANTPLQQLSEALRFWGWSSSPCGWRTNQTACWGSCAVCLIFNMIEVATQMLLFWLLWRRRVRGVYKSMFKNIY